MTRLGTAGRATKRTACAGVTPLPCGWYQKETRNSLRIDQRNVCHVGSGAKQGRDGGGQQRSHCTSKHAVACWGFFFFSVTVSHTTHCKSQSAFFSCGVEKKKKKEEEKSYLFQRAFLLATSYSALQSYYSNCLKLQLSWDGAGKE